jgi:SAM-dependent methyltransferase
LYLHIIDLFKCPRLFDGQHCTGHLVSDKAGLKCEKCGAVFRVSKGVPVLRSEEGTAGEIYYDGTYEGKRSRTRDLSLGGMLLERELIDRAVHRHKIEGPTLDVGCGVGVFAAHAPGYVGLDYSLEAITSEGTEDFPFVCGTAESLPFRDQVFGCLISFNALEHVPRIDVAFAEIDRVLKPGGYVILKPAWHTTRYQTELLPVKHYHELTNSQKLTKALLPVLTSRPYKMIKAVPWRIWRRLTAARPTRLAFKPLTPNYSQWIADSDAAASVDCHEGILYFESRAYACLSHPRLSQRLLAGHHTIILRKS